MDTFHVSQTVHSNFYVYFYVYYIWYKMNKKLLKHYVKVKTKKCNTLTQFGNNLEVYSSIYFFNKINIYMLN